MACAEVDAMPQQAHNNEARSSDNCYGPLTTRSSTESDMANSESTTSSEQPPAELVQVFYLFDTSPLRPSGTADVYLLWFPSRLTGYVGASKKGARARFSSHMRNAKHGRTTQLVSAEIAEHGAPALYVLEQPLLCQLAESEQWWIDRLGTQVPLGLNLSRGGPSRAGVKRMVDVGSGQSLSMPVEQQTPQGYAGFMSGKSTYVNRETGEHRVFMAGEAGADWSHVNTGFANYRHKITGEISRRTSDSLGPEWVGANSGTSLYRSLATGEVRRFPSGTAGSGWVHISVGMVQHRHLDTGEVRRFKLGSAGQEWVPVNVGKVIRKNAKTGEYKWLAPDQLSPEWVSGSTNGKPVKVNGVVYPSASSALSALGLPSGGGKFLSKGFKKSNEVRYKGVIFERS